MFGYDAVDPQNKRKAPTSILRTEDNEANEADRRKLLGGGRDTVRNFTLAAWMVRRHIDYVTTFTYKAKTGNRELDKKLEAIVAERSKPALFDAAGRHGRKRALRLAEARRTVDGDVLPVRLANRTLQWVEGDRLRVGNAPPAGLDLTKIVHGVEIDQAGRATRYAVSRRGPAALLQDSSFTFERMVPAYNAYLHGYFDRFDQVRGVSPLKTAFNELRDLYEGIDYARAKMKVSQLFALAIFRKLAGDDGDGFKTEETDDDGTGYQIDFGKGPVFLDLDPGDDAKFLESNTPSTEMQAFCQFVIMLALKALDIPYSIYAENFTNYSGSRGARLDYERACVSKRDDNRDLLDWWSGWQFLMSLLEGELPGVDPAMLTAGEWIHIGLPWLDPLKEVLGLKEELALGINTRTRICTARGLSLKKTFCPSWRESQLLVDAGLPLNTNTDNALIAALVNDAPHQDKTAA